MHIFQILGLAYLTIGLGIIINPVMYRKVFQDMTKSPSFIFLAGIIALLTGYLLISFNNTWVWGLPLIITIIGWLALIKGMMMLIYPNPLLKIAEKMCRKALSAKGIIIFILGIIFASIGFGIF